MNHKIAKIGVTSVVLLLAFGGLLWSTLRDETEYYKHVDEVMANRSDWADKKLQLHGFVVGAPLRARDSLDYRFTVQNNGVAVPALYSGVVPDTFKEDSEVVLKGTLQSDGFHVDPNGVMAKCPSKYTPKAASPSTRAGN